MTQDIELADIGLIGLGVMGINLAKNFAEKGFSVIGHDSSPSHAMNEPAIYVHSQLKDFVRKLAKPRKILFLLPAGQTVEEVIQSLVPYLEPEDLIVDAGNSHFEDTKRRSQELATKKINYLGLGVSGGEDGARNGASFMAGGKPDIFENIKPFLEAAAARDPDNNICAKRLGDAAEVGHFVKMVHNSIEYAEMQLLSEVYSQFAEIKGYNNEDISKAITSWRNELEGSFLSDVTSKILKTIDNLTDAPLIDMIEDIAEQKGTGKWGTVSGIDLGVPAPTLYEGVSSRFISQCKPDRITASKIYRPVLHKNNALSTDTIRRAFLAAKICAFAQGFQLLKIASLKYSWNLKLSDVAEVWKAGCILRGNILNKIVEAFDRKASLTNLLLDTDLSEELKRSIPKLRLVVSEAALCGLPLAAHSASLSYFDSFIKSKLPMNIIQAQRDFFGSHGYRRIDRSGTFHTSWED